MGFIEEYAVHRTAGYAEKSGQFIEEHGMQRRVGSSYSSRGAEKSGQFIEQHGMQRRVEQHGGQFIEQHGMQRRVGSSYSS